MRKNRQRILDSAVDLFNQAGTIATTTNHISKYLGISPGNLYFHFSNKEEIVRELFQVMCKETYEVWSPDKKLAPILLIDESLEVLWKYRFFHREMYHLRRTDPELSKRWRRHLNRCLRLLKLHYGQWMKAGYVRPINERKEMEMVFDSVLLFSSASLNFFESPDKPASKRPLKIGSDYLKQVLTPYLTPDYRRGLDA